MFASALWQVEMTPWYAILLYWSITFQNVKGTKIPEDAASRSKHLLFVVPAVVLMFTGYLRIGPLARRFVPQQVWIQYVAILLTCCGAAMAIVARYILGQYWSARVEVKLDHRLIQSGPYSLVRHPIYTGLILASAGTALFIGEWRAVLAVGLGALGFALKARKEEFLMTSEFGELYREYARQTGFLLPRCW
jgi:protein-S-isoprenylcysteine O-methyltransferase Ste14